LAWKNREKEYSIKWGSNEFYNTKERDREQFEASQGETIDIMTCKIHKESQLKYWLSYIVSFLITLIMMIFAITCLTIFQELQLPARDVNTDLDILFHNIKNNIAQEELVNTILPYFIGVFNKVLSKIFDYLCIKITDIENHQKESSYSSSYLWKQFAFNVVNHYFTFYYIILVKFRNKTCPDQKCLEYLQIQLTKIFLTYFALTAVEVLLPFLQRKYIKRKIDNIIVSKYPTLLEPEIKNVRGNLYRKYKYIIFPHYPEEQLVIEYFDIIILFGFVSQFGIVQPVLFILFAVYVYLQRLIDADKLSRFYNVEAFRNTDGIGIINKIMKLIQLLSIFSNLYITYFIKGVDEALLRKTYHYNAFIVCQNIFLVMVFFLDYEQSPKWMNYYKQIRSDFIKNRTLYWKDRFFTNFSFAPKNFNKNDDDQIKIKNNKF
jgi:hypothetical protein